MNVKYLMSKNTLSSSLLWIKALKRVTAFIFLFLILLNKAEALNVYSVATGAWNSTATWSNISGGAPGAAIPVAGDDVFVEGGFTVTLDVNTAATLNSISISSGSALTTTAAFTINVVQFNVNGTYTNGSTGTLTATLMNVNGTFTNTANNTLTVTTLNMNAGSIYNHAFNGGNIPTATWNITSTCNITGVIGTVPGVLTFAQTFGNFTWDCQFQTGNLSLAGNLTNVAGNLTVSRTNTGSLRLSNSGANATLNIGGNFSQNNIGTFFIGGTLGTNNWTVNVAGNFSVSAGTLDMNGFTGGATIINVTGNFSNVAGTITESSTSVCTINFVSGATQTYTSGGTISNQINFNVNTGTTLQMAAAGTIVSGAGTFTLAAGATLGIRSTAGITTTGATGNIQVTGTRTYTAGANYIYNGTANQVVGDGLTQNTPLNVTINNAGNTVSLGLATTITGLMSVTAGTLNMNNFAATVGSLTGSGTITNSGAAAQTLTVGSDNTSTTYAGIIQNGTGTVSLIKNGTGTLTLSGTNTYTGATTINAGILSVATIGDGGVAGNMGQATNGSANLVLGGGTLRYTGATASTNRNYTLAVGTTSSIDITTNTLTIAGAAAGTNGALTKLGNGKLILSGTNGYTGLTTVNAGTLEYGANNALSSGAVTVNNGSELDISTFNDIVGAVTLINGSINGSTGVLTGTSYDVQSGTVTAILAGAVNLTKTTAGTVTMSGASTYTGTTTISGGVLSVNSIQSVSGGASALGAPTTAGNGTIAMASGTTLQYTGAGHTSNRVINLTGVTPTGAIIDASGSGALTLSGGVTGSTFNLVLTGTGSATQSGVIATTSGGLTKNGTGTWTLTGLNTYIGVTNITSGTLSVSSIANGGAASSIGASAVDATNLVIGNATLEYTGGSVTTNRAFSLSNGLNSTIDVTTNNLTFTAASGNFTSGRLVKAGAGTLTLSAANNWTGGTTLNAGTLNINNAGALGTVAGSFIINSGNIDNTSGVNITTLNYPLQIQGDFTYIGAANTLNLGTGATVIAGNPTINTVASTLRIRGVITPTTVSITKSGAGTLAFGTANVSVNNLTISAGSLTSTSGTLTLAGDFSNSGTFTNNAGTVVLSGASTILGTSTTTFNNLQLNGSTTITTNPIMNGTLTMQEGGSVSSGTVTYTASGNLRYNGTSGFTTSDGEFPSSSGPLYVNINNSGNITLHASRTLASPGVLTLTSGRFILGSNDFTLSNTALGAIVAGTAFSATNMIQADGTGQLIRATVAASYIYPVGDATGTAEYSPATFNFSANATARNIGVRVVNAAHPQLNNTPVQSDYITRYWPVTNSNAAGTYTYNVSLTYAAADLVGAFSNVRLDKYTGSSWEQDAASSSTAGFVLTANGMTHITMPITNASTNEFTGRVNDGSTYTWNQTVSGAWTTTTNWTPTRTTPAVNDILIFNNGATTTVTALPTQTISKILFTSNTNINLQSTGTANILTIAGGNGNDFAIDAGSSLNLGSTGGNRTRILLANAPNGYINGTLTLTANTALDNTFDNTNSTLTSVTGTINNAGVFTNTNAAKLTFTGTAAYNHNHTNVFGTIPTATWAATTTCSILGFTNPAAGGFPADAAQSYGNFTWNTPAMTTTPNMSGIALNVAGTFTLVSTNTQSIRMGTNSSGTITCNNYTQSGGTIDMSAGTGSGTINCSGTFNFSGGTITENGSGTAHLLNFNGTSNQSLTFSSSPANTINYIFNNIAGFTLNSNILLAANTNLTHTAGVFSGAGLITYNATGTRLIYNGTANYTTTNKEWPAVNGPINVTLDKTGGAGNNVVTLHAARTLATGTFTLTNGVLSLGSNDFTISNTAANAITVTTPNSERMIAAEGTGQLKRGITGANTYVFPIGDITGATEYAGISLVFTANSATRVLGFRCPDGRNANDSTTLLPAVDLTTRTWLSTLSVTTGTYTYTPTISYASPGDVYGTEENMLVSNWTGGAWAARASLITPGIPISTIGTTGTVNEGTLSLNNAQIIGRAPIKYWKGDLSNDYATAGNWVPSGVPIASDNVQIAFFTNFPCVLASGSQSVNHFDVSGTGNLTVSSGATLTIGGNFTYDNSEGATAIFDCGSTLNITNGTYTQTIPALNYGSLNVAGGNRILASSGTISICNDYTPTAGTLTTTGSTVVFNGTTTQNVLINTTSFNNLTIANTLASVVSSRITTVNGTMQINANARYEQTGQTLTIAASGLGNVDGFLRNSAATITPTGTLTFTSTGTYEHNYLIAGGAIPTSTWLAGSTCLIRGYTTGGGANFTLTGLGQSFHHFTWNCPNQTNNALLASQLINVNGNFTIISSGISSQLRYLAGTTTVINIGGNLVTNGGYLNVSTAAPNATFNVGGDFILSSGTFDMSTGGGTVAINLAGNFSQSGGTLTKTGVSNASINFNNASNTQTIEQTAGTISNNINWNVNGTSNTLQLISNVNLGTGTGSLLTVNAAKTIDFQTFVLSGSGTFTAVAGSILKTSNANGFVLLGTASGSVQTTNARNYNAAANYIYNGTSAQATGTGLTAAANLIFDNTSGANPGVTLTSSTTVSGILTLTNGIVQLGNNNLTVSGTTSAAISGGSSTAFIKTGTTTINQGQLIRAIATAGLPITYNFPVGTLTNYTPASFTFTANSAARNLKVSAIGATHPNINTPNAQVNYIANRYWKSDLSTNAGTYTYNSSFTYLPGDIVGSVSSVNLNRRGGAVWIENTTSSATGNVLSSGTLTNNTTGQLTQTAGTTSSDWVGRVNNRTFVWNGSVSSAWGTAANWTPAGPPATTDNVIINVPGTNTLNITSAVTIYDIDVTGTGLFNMSATGTLTALGDFTYSSSGTSTLNSASTVNIANTISQPVPAINFGNLNLGIGPRVLASTGTIGISGNYTSTTGALATTGSTVNFNGTTAQAINTNPATFNNLTITNPSATVNSSVAITIESGATLSINGNATNTRFSLSSGGIDLTGATANITSGILRSGTPITGGTITFAANGTYEHNYTALPGTIPTATWVAGSTCKVIGYTTNATAPSGLNQTFSNFNWSCASQTANINFAGALTTINGNFTVNSTNASSIQLTADNSDHTLTIGGDFILNAGTLDLRAANNQNSTFNVAGNFTINGGTFTKSGGAVAPNVNFNEATATQTFFNAGTISGNINWNINGISNTVQLTSNVGLGTGSGIFTVNNGTTIDFQNFVLSGNGSFVSNTGSNLITANANGFVLLGTASGSLQTTTARTYNATANYVYNGTSAQATGTGLTAAANLTFANTSGANPSITITSPATVSNMLTLTSGIVELGANDLTISNTANTAIAGATSSKFIKTSGIGNLVWALPVIASSTAYTFPIGTAANYTPATFTFTASSNTSNFKVRAIAATHPQINNPNTVVNFIGNRYWATDWTGAGTYTYSSAFTYLPSDVNGTLANVRLNKYNGSTWSEDANSSAVGTILSSGTLTNATGSLAATAEWSGRTITSDYTWNGSASSVYTTAANWTPNGIPTANDNVIINTPGANTLNITGSISVNNFTLSGTGTFNMDAASTFIINGDISYSGTPTANISCSSTFKITKATSQIVPDLNYGNLDLIGGPRVLNSTGTIGVCGTFTPSLSATTITGSTVNINGTAAQSLSPTAFAFNNLTISNITAPVTSAVNVTVNGIADINSNANLTLSANQLIIASGATANVSGTLLVNGGTVSNSGTLNINANGNLRLNNSSAISVNAPIYDATSNLIYNSSGTFNRGLEWSATSGPGYPGNVQISNNTLLDLGNGATAAAKRMAGNLLIDDGSALSMNVSPMTASLTVNGNITIGASGTATLSLSSLAGGELFVGGNWTRNASSVFNHNNKKVTFNKSVAGNQTIAGSSSFETFYDLTIQPSSGNVIMNKEVNALNSLNLLSGKLDLNGNEFTLGNIGVNGTLTGGSATSYLISGNTTAKLTRYTTTNATTYNYPVGDAANYTPISVQFYTGPMAANTQISVDVIPSAHPSIGTSTNYLSRYWQVEPTNMPNIVTPYSVVYQWAPADEATAPIPANLKAFKHNSQGWIAGIGSGANFEQGNATINPGTRTISWVGLWSFSDFTGNGNGTPLPISLLDFNVQTVLDDVDVTWTTATETNNDFFTVEKSIDGKNFEVAGVVEGAGNSNELLAYSFKDTQPYDGVSYYRLKQTDFDGKYSYTGILSVQFNAKSNNNVFSIFPNPSELNGVYLNTNGADKTDVMVKIVDIAGKVLLSQQLNVLTGNQPLFISTAGIQSGVYILEVSTPTENKSFKLVLKN